MNRIKGEFGGRIDNNEFLRGQSYSQQYANLYWLRLLKLRPQLKQSALNQWSKQYKTASKLINHYYFN